MKIGVISDTHGFLDPKIPGLFAGVEHILHAGDIGPDSIIAELRTIAPVTAVSGNTDSFSPYRATELIHLSGYKFLVHHIVNPAELKDELQTRITRECPKVVVFGHTHKKAWTSVNGVHYLNPGYSGKPKSGEERTVAILNGIGKEIWPDFLKL